MLLLLLTCDQVGPRHWLHVILFLADVQFTLGEKGFGEWNFYFQSEKGNAGQENHY